MEWQLRVRGGEPVEEDLGRARSGPHQPVAEPHAGDAEPVARDLVDRARVEVVHERIGITFECVGADGGQCRCDLIEGLLHRFVDRGAPVGEPRASAVLELGVEQALGDRACGQLDQRECGAGGASQLELGRRRGSELDQLLETDAAGARTVTELCQIRHGGDPDGEIAGGQRTVAVAGEHGRADILLPQDLERCALGNGVQGE